MKPLSLLTRTNLILGVGSLTIVATTLLALTQMVIRPIEERWAQDQAALIELTAKTWVELPPVARPFFELELAANHGVIVTDDVRSLTPLESGFAYAEVLESSLGERLRQEVSLMEGDEMMWATISMGGHELQFGFDESSIDARVFYAVILIVTLMAGIVSVTSLILVRRIARPLVQVSEAASDFRGGGGFEPLPEKGPRELVRLVRSFNVMADEVTELIASRNTLLAGISHDLRTPLTRMRLSLELLPAGVELEVRQRLQRNLQRMDELVGDALLLARGIREDVRPLDLRETLEEIIHDFDACLDWDASAEPGITVLVAAAAFRRVLQNLLENAQRHGGGQVEIVVKLSRMQRPAGVEIHLQDRGPGIPLKDMERVFQPFVRLHTGHGSGLGLSIVRQLCDMYGWKVHMHERQGGGLHVCLALSSNDLMQFDTNETYSRNVRTAEYAPVDSVRSSVR